MVAQVQSEGENGFVRLVVKQCATKRDEYWRYEVPPLPIGTEINRRREPMASSKIEVFSEIRLYLSSFGILMRQYQFLC